MKTMQHNIDNITSFGIGAIAGIVKFIFTLNIATDSASRIGEAVMTAGLCGFAGMAGKELYGYIKKAFFKRKPKK
jgi:uncharacterized membrane protein YebE (DUF533 family)